MFTLVVFTLGCWSGAYSQITWGPVAPTLSDQAFTTAGPSEWVNMDMYANSTSAGGGLGQKVIAIVWDVDLGGGVYNSYYYIYDEYSGWSSGVKTLATGARHPDVIIGDHVTAVTPASPGTGYVGFVYEDVANSNIYYNHIYFYGMMGTGSPGLGTLPAAQQVSSGNGNDEFDPHIDGYFRPDANTFYTAATQYEQFGNFVITWTEDNIFSGNKEIYVENGYLGGSLAGSVTYIADGERSDVGAVSFDNGSSHRGQAHLIYVDGSGYPTYAEYNVATNSVVGSPTTLSSYTVSSGTWPRIDAKGVMDTTSPATTKEAWIGVAQLDSLVGRTVIESYSASSGPGILDNYNTYPGLGSWNGYHPAVCTGPGPDDYFVHFGQFGTEHYQLGWYIDGNEIEALEYDDVSSPPNPYSGYFEVNTNALSVFARPAVLAVSTSSNNGFGFGAAWYDYGRPCPTCPLSDYIKWKQYGTANIQYEPASGIESIQGNTLTTLPNPASEFVQINGLEGETTYKAMDLNGKTVLEGSVSNTQNQISIMQLPAGTYIFHIGAGEATTVLKLIKK